MGVNLMHKPNGVFCQVGRQFGLGDRDTAICCDSLMVINHRLHMMRDENSAAGESANRALACVDVQHEQEYVAKIIQEYRRQALDLASARGGMAIPGTRYQQSHGDKLRKPQVFYSLDGDEIVTYEVEVNTDGLLTHEDTADSFLAAEDQSAVDHTTKGHRQGCPAPSFFYNPSMHKDILEQYDLVEYHESDKNATASEGLTDTPERWKEIAKAATAHSTRSFNVVASGDRKVQGPEHSNSLPSLPTCNYLCNSGIGTWLAPSGDSQSTIPTRNGSQWKGNGTRTVDSMERRSRLAVLEPDENESLGKANHNRRRYNHESGRRATKPSQSMEQTDSEVIHSTKNLSNNISATESSLATSFALALRTLVVTFVDDVVDGIHEAERQWYADDDDNRLDEDTVDCETLATGSTTLHELVYSESNVCLEVSGRIFACKPMR